MDTLNLETRIDNQRGHENDRTQIHVFIEVRKFHFRLSAQNTKPTLSKICMWKIISNISVLVPRTTLSDTKPRLREKAIVYKIIYTIMEFE